MFVCWRLGKKKSKQKQMHDSGNRIYRGLIDHDYEKAVKAVYRR